MVAAPFKIVLKFKTAKGVPLQYSATATDVNAAYYLFQDGQDNLTLPSMYGTLYLTDVILSAAGTDTSTGSIFINGKRCPDIIMNAANVATNLSRQFMGAPIGVMAGANFRVQQVT